MISTRLKKRGGRDDVLIATKARLLAVTGGRELKPTQIVAAVERSR